VSEAKCSACKHWNLERRFDDWREEEDCEGNESVAVRAWREGWRLCGYVPFTGDEDDGQARAVVEDGSGYTGKLYTHPDFFCAHWEQSFEAFMGRVMAQLSEARDVMERLADKLDEEHEL
jgi:hypothetical protein